MHHRFADGRAVVDEVEAAVAGARIVLARLVVVVGQFDQRIVLAQRDRFGGGRDAGDGAGEQAAAESAAAASAAAPAPVPMAGGPCAGPPPPPPRPPAASLVNVSVTSISVFLGNALVRAM